MPVPMMLAITMEHAVMKPTVRLGPADFTDTACAMVVIVRLTVPKLSRPASSFGVAFELILLNGLTPQSYLSSSPELSEVIPGITLKAA